MKFKIIPLEERIVLDAELVKELTSIDDIQGENQFQENLEELLGHEVVDSKGDSSSLKVQKELLVTSTESLTNFQGIDPSQTSMFVLPLDKDTSLDELYKFINNMRS